MDTEIIRPLAVLLAALGLPTIIGSFVLASKYLRIIEKRGDNDAELKRVELEMAARSTALREKEMELEARRLEFDILALEQKNEPKKLA
jgi:hypothetical protein